MLIDIPGRWSVARIEQQWIVVCTGTWSFCMFTSCISERKVDIKLFQHGNTRAWSLRAWDANGQACRSFWNSNWLVSQDKPIWTSWDNNSTLRGRRYRSRWSSRAGAQHGHWWWIFWFHLDWEGCSCLESGGGRGRFNEDTLQHRQDITASYPQRLLACHDALWLSRNWCWLCGIILCV